MNTRLKAKMALRLGKIAGRGWEFYVGPSGLWSVRHRSATGVGKVAFGCGNLAHALQTARELASGVWELPPY